MNLEELQIKIGIELKELNKQLKQASDDINKTLGPKATKKMMADNNKVIKDGFKVMEKTAKDSAKQINRDLNNAFDIDKTLVKFNKSIDRSMEQAKRSVRSACNDIRRELNAALNVNANIRVSASASMQRKGSYAKSDSAAIIQSNQYTAAMIVKAINGMITANSKDISRLEGTLSKSADKIVSAITKLNTKTNERNSKNTQSLSNKSNNKTEVQVDVKTDIKVIEKDLQSEINKIIKSISSPEIETTIVVNSDDLQNEVYDVIRKIDVPTLETSIEVTKDGLQNEVNKTVREVDTPTFKTSIEVRTNELQNEVNEAIQKVKVPNLKTSIEINTVGLQSKVNEAIRKIKVPTLKTTIGVEGSNIPNFDLGKSGPLDTSQGVSGQVTKPQRPDWYNPTPGVEKTLSSEIIDVDAIKSVTSKAIKEFDDIRSELGSLDFKVIEESLIDIGDYVEPLKKQLEPVTKELLKVEAIDDEKISLNLDASDAKEQLRIIHEMYEDLIKACKTNNLNELKKALGVSEQSKSSGRQYPPKPNIRRNRYNYNDRSRPDFLSSKENIDYNPFEGRKAEVDLFYKDLLKLQSEIDSFVGESQQSSIKLSMTDEDIEKAKKELSELENEMTSYFENYEKLQAALQKEVDSYYKNCEKGQADLVKEMDLYFKVYSEHISELENEMTSYLKNYEKLQNKIKSFAPKADYASSELGLQGSIEEYKQKLLELEKNKDSYIKSSLEKQLKLEKNKDSYLESNLGKRIELEKIRDSLIESNLKRQVELEKNKDSYVESSLEKQLKLHNKIGSFAKKSQHGSSGLPVVYDDTLNKQFTDIKNSINDAYKGTDRFKQKAEEALMVLGACSGMFNKVRTETLAAFDLFSSYMKKQFDGIDISDYIFDIDTERARHTFNKLLLMIGQDMEAQIEKNTTDMFKALQQPGAFLPGAFTDVARLKKAINGLDTNTGENVIIDVIEPGIDLTNELEKNIDDIFKALQQPGAFLPGAFKDVARLKKAIDNLRGGGSGSGSGGGPRLPGSGNFTTGGSNGPTPTDTGRQFDSHVAIHKAVKAYEQIKEKLNEIKDEYKKMANTISKIANKFTAPFKKMLSGLKGVVSGTKSMWSKITGIFKKGAKDCEKATSGLSLKLKDLLKTALSFGSIYGLINIGKQAITESQELAQAESKLTALMRQRMGATNDTVKAIRNLAAEQAKAGVVSETAMVKGAEQLSMYVHSAKALKELMPAIANMTARRGGLFATPDDAEEIATQLGEAIREGSITPLEQSGIYLSEAEIKKFQALRTEEERAAYLADVIAENVGDINKALANTPHGQIAQLKNNFKSLLGTLGTLLVNVIQPIVKWLNVIVVAATNALKALGELLGFDMSGGGLMGVGDVGTGTAPDTGGIDDVGDSLDDAKDSAEEAEEAVEKFKGSLMGFDEINILSNNLNDKDKEKDDPTNITPGEGGQLDPGEYVPPEITEGENIFTKFGEKMKAFLDEFLEPFKAAWDLLGDDLKAEWADLIESFKHFCDSLGSFLKSVWDNGGKEFVQHMAEIGLACAKAAMEIGGEILDSLARLWDHLDPSKNMHTQRLLDVLNEVSEKIRDFILGLGDHFESLMANGGQDVLNALGDCFMDLGAAAVNGLGVAIDALDGLIDHLDPAVNENTRNMLQALADMFHAVGEAAWDFSELLRSALENGGQDMINAFGDMMMNLGETVARVITTMMESFSKFFDYIDPAKNDITKGMMKAWEEAFLAIGDAALGFAELFESVMANGGQEVLNKLGDAFNSLVGLVGTCVQEIADAMNGLFEHLDPKTNEFTQNMLKAWEEAFESISGMAKDIGEVLGSVMDNGGQEVVNAIGDLGVKIVGAFGKVTGTVADCVGDLFKHLDPAENKIAKGALESFEYFINSIGDFVDSLADALGTFMDNGGQEFVNNMGDIIALIGDLAFTIGGDILNAISTFMDSWLGHAVISTCATALELVSEVLKGLLEILEPLSPIISGVVAAFAGFQVASKVVGFISSIVSAFQALGGAGGILALVKGGFTALWAVLSANPIAAIVAAIVGIGVAIVALYNKCEGFREFIDGILKGFQDLFNELKEHFSNLLEDVRNIFGNVIDIITGIFEGDGEKVGTAVRELIGNIIDLMMDMNKAFVEVGWALIKGLVQGIWECIKALPSLLAGIGEFVVDFFKGLFGIHSPSTVFAELGKNLIEGLVKGITDSINLVTGAFKKVCDAITNTIKDISKAVSDKFKEIKEGISEKLKETKEVVSEKWSEIKTTVSEKAKETYDAAKDNWANLKQTVSERARETYEAVKGNWENLKQNTIDRFKETYDIAQERFTNIREAIKEKATKTFEDVSNSWTKIKEDAGNKLEQIKTDAEKRYEDVKNTLVNKIEEAKKGIVEKWEEVRNKTNECIENVRQTSEEKYNEIKETIVNRLEDIKSSTEKKWEEIKKNTGTAVENIKKEAEEQYGKIKDSLLDTLEKTKSAMATKWENIKTDAINKVSEIVKQATTKFGEIKKNFGDKLDEVKSSLTSKWKSLSTQAFNGAKDLVSQAKSGLSSIGTTISDAITGSKSKVRSALNEVGKVFSQADWSLPKLKMPHIKITGKWGFNPPSWPKFSVEWYKRGGIIDGITPLGMTGGTMHMAGEAGSELVMPLENTSFTSKIAKALGQAVDNAMARNNNNKNNNSNPFANNNGDIILQVDGREFARCSINQINKLQAESGRTLLNI